jgi:hypothetical protein
MRKLITLCAILLFSAFAVSAQTAKDKEVKKQVSAVGIDVNKTTPATNAVTSVNQVQQATPVVTNPALSSTTGQGTNKYGLHGPKSDPSSREFKTEVQQWRTNYPDEYNAYIRTLQTK